MSTVLRSLRCDRIVVSWCTESKRSAAATGRLSAGTLTRMGQPRKYSARVYGLVSALAILLTLPALPTGWEGDDLVHRLVMVDPGRAAELGVHNIPTPGGYFSFLRGDPEAMRGIIDAGAVPWWTSPHAQSSFFRPLAFYTHWLDYRLWPDRAAFMHAQSILWYAALCLVLTGVYRSILGPGWVAGWAAVLYAVDDSHAMPVGWIANRNALLAAGLGAAALLAHHRWRTRRSWPFALVGSVCFLLSLLCGEGGVAIAGYLFAYACCLDRATWSRRFLSLVPYGLIVIGWRAAWLAGGYGSRGMGLYTDPLAQPLAFLEVAIERAPLMLLGQFAIPPPDISIFVGLATWRIWWLGAVVVLIGLAIAMTPLLRRLPAARFFGLGSLIALVPACATYTSDRNLLIVGFGVMGLIACALTSAFSRQGTAEGNATRLRGGLLIAIPLLIVHAVLAPLGLVIRTAAPLGPRYVARQLELPLFDGPEVERQTIAVVSAPSVFHFVYVAVRAGLTGQTVPAHLRALAPSLAEVSVTRSDERTLEIRPRNGYLHSPIDTLFRSRSDRFRSGERITLTGTEITVTEVTPDGRPAAARFRFDVPLEDPSLRWLQWREGTFVPFIPPPTGSTVTLPAPIPYFTSPT